MKHISDTARLELISEIDGSDMLLTVTREDSPPSKSSRGIPFGDGIMLNAPLFDREDLQNTGMAMASSSLACRLRQFGKRMKKGKEPLTSAMRVHLHVKDKTGATAFQNSSILTSRELLSCVVERKAFRRAADIVIHAVQSQPLSVDEIGTLTIFFDPISEAEAGNFVNGINMIDLTGMSEEEVAEIKEEIGEAVV